MTNSRWTSPYMGVTIVYGDGGAPDEGSGRLVTYDPADELLATRAELARLRQVKELAIELAQFILDNKAIGRPSLLFRARALGLLP